MDWFLVASAVGPACVLALLVGLLVAVPRIVHVHSTLPVGLDVHVLHFWWRSVAAGVTAMMMQQGSGTGGGGYL